MGDFIIQVDELRRRLGTPGAPKVFDVRRRAAFDAADRVIPAASWRDHGEVEDWAASIPAGVPVVVYCVHGHQVSQAAAAALRARNISARVLRGGFEGWRAGGGPTILKDADPGPSQKRGSSRWVTRRDGPGTDRVACAWLLRRFVDREALIYFVDADQVEAGAVELDAVPFGVSGVAFGPDQDGCCFDIFLDRFGIEDPGLWALAGVVRGAETGRHELAPQAAGMQALSWGAAALAASDQEVLEQGIPLCDALYAWCRSESWEEP